MRITPFPRKKNPIIPAISVILAVMIVAAALNVLVPFSSAQASTVKLAPIGEAGEIFGRIAAYCGEWNRQIGSSVGCDLSFSSDKLVIIQKKHYDMGGNQVTTFNMDGILFDADDHYTVYSIAVPIRSGTQAQYAATARIFALINTLAYDFPDGPEGMTARYTDLLDRYTAFMEENRETLSSGDFAYWEIETEKGEFEFQFIAEEGRLLMRYDRMYFVTDPQ